MTDDTSQAVLATIIAAAGALALLGLTILVGQQQHGELGHYFLYQALSLGVALAVIMAIALVRRQPPQFLRWGQLSAPGRKIALLGVRQGESWARTGTIFAVIVALVTGLHLSLAGGGLPGTPGIGWPAVIALAMPLSLSNAVVEEVVTRWSLVEGLRGSSARYAPWISALIFGSIHYFGIPGSWPGMAMAGFLAWLLTRSIQECRGLGWALIIHFCLDMMIFSVTLSHFL